MLPTMDGKMEEGSIYNMLWMFPLNVDATSQYGGCPKEGGKQGNMSMYESESNSKDRESSL